MIRWTGHRKASEDAVLDGSTGYACDLISRETGAESPAWEDQVLKLQAYILKVVSL